MVIDQELIDFATDFSENYTTQKCDTYLSGEMGSGKYLLEYIEFRDRDKRNFNVGMDTGTMLFVRSELTKYNKNFVFYMVIWMGIHAKLIKDGERYPIAHTKSDEIALEYYLTTDRNRKDIATDFINSVRHAINPFNIERVKVYIAKTKVENINYPAEEFTGLTP